MNYNKTRFNNIMISRRLVVTFNFWISMLCCWNDARCDESLRHGSIRNYFSSLTPSFWLDHRSRYFNQQNGTNNSTTLWTNAWTTLSAFDGKLCKWGWVLPLFLFSCSWMWSNHTRGYLCTRMPTDRWSSLIWTFTTAR